jgi:hypothetical protein
MYRITNNASLLRRFILGYPVNTGVSKNLSYRLLITFLGVIYQDFNTFIAKAAAINIFQAFSSQSESL